MDYQLKAVAAWLGVNKEPGKPIFVAPVAQKFFMGELEHGKKCLELLVEQGDLIQVQQGRMSVIQLAPDKSHEKQADVQNLPETEDVFGEKHAEEKEEQEMPKFEQKLIDKEQESRYDSVPPSARKAYAKLAQSKVWKQLTEKGVAGVQDFIRRADELGGIRNVLRSFGIMRSGRFPDSVAKNLPHLRKFAVELDSFSDEEINDVVEKVKKEQWALDRKQQNERKKKAKPLEQKPDDAQEKTVQAKELSLDVQLQNWQEAINILQALHGPYENLVQAIEQASPILDKLESLPEIQQAISSHTSVGENMVSVFAKIRSILTL